MAEETESGLGPFQVPAGYAPPPELWGPAPRRIPEGLEQGKYDRDRRRACTVLLVFGFVCVWLSFLPLVRRLDEYVLPLGYLDWLGGGLILLGMLGMLLRKLVPGRFRYVRDGVPMPVRVIGVVKCCLLRVNGQDSQHGFTVGIEFPHPQTGELCACTLKSPGFSSGGKDEYDTPLRIGQYVTAVYLPGKPEKSLNLYGFLELNPEVNYVQCRQDRNARGSSPWEALLAVLGIGLFLGALLWSLYAFSFYEPLTFEYQRILRPALIGGLIIGTGLIAFLVRLAHGGPGTRERHNRTTTAAGTPVPEIASPSLWRRRDIAAWLLKGVLVAGAVMLGAALTVSGLFTINAEADRSVPDYRLVEIQAFLMATHNAVIRTYQIEYRLPGSAQPQFFSTTLAHIREFPAKVGFLEVGAGRLGWPWVRQLHPAPPE